MNPRSTEELATLGSWSNGVSRRPSPGARVLAALIITTGIATLPRIGGAVALAILGCCVVAALVSKPDLRRLSLRLTATLAMLGALLLPFVVGGDGEQAARLGLRALGAATIALTFTSRLTGIDLARAFGALRAPVALVEVLEGLSSQLDNLQSTAQRILLARRLRGAHGVRGTLSIIVELLVRSAERAERLGLARRLRGYDYTQLRSSFGRNDWVPVLVATAGAFGLHLLAW